MMMSVLERTGEIGTARALCTRRRSILRLFLSEGALLGLIGGLIGVLVGLLLASVVSAIGIPMPPPPGMAFGYRAGILVNWRLALDAVALALSTTIAASV